MYESMIKIIQNDLEMQLEGEIINAVQRAGITVDRDELIRALRYDREQYQKGFDDAMKDAVTVIRCKDCKRLVSVNVDGKGIPICRVSGMSVAQDEFCSRGERRDDGKRGNDTCN